MDRELWPETLWEDLKELWQEPHGDRSQEVVFIGQFKTKDDIEALLDTCLLTDDEMALEEWNFEGDNILPKWGEEEHDHNHEGHGHTHEEHDHKHEAHGHNHVASVREGPVAAKPV